MSDAEVAELDEPVERDEHIGGGDVAVDDPEGLAVGARAPVGVVEAAQRVRQDGQGELERDRDLLLRAAAEQRVEVEALDVLHRDEQPPVGPPEVIDLRDVGVVEEGGELRLVDEHLRELRQSGEGGEDLLDHDEPLATELGPRARQEDLGRSSHPDAVEQEVVAELARQARRG